MRCFRIRAGKRLQAGARIFIQKGEDLFGAVLECVKKTTDRIGDKKKKIEAISFTGQMSGFMGVDKDWNDITTWSCSLDSRYMPYAEKQMQELKDMFLRIGGTNFPQMAPKYAWFKNEYPEESKKIAKYLMISGYVIGKLGDIGVEDAVIDRSFTEWTGLADVQHDRWSEEICGRIGLDQKYLPRIVNSNQICAHLNQKMADMLGLKAGIPLVSGAGDKAAGCLGAAIVDYGDTIFEASSYERSAAAFRNTVRIWTKNVWMSFPPLYPETFFRPILSRVPELRWTGSWTLSRSGIRSR